jgi:hypothetical protein
MICPRRDEDRLPRCDRDVTSLDGENAVAVEHDVDLVVIVRLLLIRLGRDEDVHPELEAGGRVDDLVPAVPGLEAPPDLVDPEGA